MRSMIQMGHRRNRSGFESKVLTSLVMVLLRLKEGLSSAG